VVEVQSIDNLSGPKLVRGFSDARAVIIGCCSMNFIRRPQQSPKKRSSARITRFRQRFQEVVFHRFLAVPFEKSGACFKWPAIQAGAFRDQYHFSRSLQKAGMGYEAAAWC